MKTIGLAGCPSGRRGLSDEGQCGGIWAQGIASEWSEELRDPCQDIYTVNNGVPANQRR